MSKSKAPEIKTEPKRRYEDPSVGPTRDYLLGELNRFKDPLSDKFLSEAVSLNPQILEQGLTAFDDLAKLQLEDDIRNIRNEAAAAGQLTSSTFSDRLGDVVEDTSTRRQAYGTQLAADLARQALQNRLSVSDMGLNAAQIAGNFGLSNQSAVNAYEQQRFENDLALDMLRIPPQTGGFSGGLTGALGGAAMGAPFGPIGMLGGAVLGGFGGATGPSGTGSSIMQSAFGLLGAGQGTSGTLGQGNIVGQGAQRSIGHSISLPFGLGNLFGLNRGGMAYTTVGGK